MRLVARAPRFLAALALAAAWTVPTVAGAAPSVDVHRMQNLGGKMVAPTANGGTARLTIDPAWQRVAERALADSRAPEGAIVVSDVKTGRIIAWASRGAGHNFVSTPLAPGASLFKVVTATALLENGKANAGTRQCYGAGGERSIKAEDVSARGGPTCTTMGDALGKSVNLVFAKLANRLLAPSEIRRTATALGFGVEPMLDVAAPRSDVEVPDDPLGMSRAAAGFGRGSLSPITALAMMQTIANNGERIKLSVLADSPARVSMGRAMSERTALELKHMLEGTTVRGTCAKAFHKRDGSRVLPHTSVAAKTGTLVTGKPTRMISWFAGFAPAERPEIAITVMLRNDVSWWEKANEVGREFLRAYFERGSGVRAVAKR